MGRFQLNALIERDTGGFGYFDAISEERVFLPFAWMDEGVEGPSEASTRTLTSMGQQRTACMYEKALNKTSGRQCLIRHGF